MKREEIVQLALESAKAKRHQYDLIVNELESEIRGLKVTVVKKGKGFKNGIHWTQTPEGRRKIAARSKKMWAERSKT